MHRSLVALTIALTLSVSIASAQTDEAETAYKEGIALRKATKDEDALAKFKKSWELSKAAKARAQMALAEQALGRWSDAETHLLEALAVKNDPWIEKQRKHLEDSVSEIGKHLGSLEVIGGVDGSEVFLNGTRIGSLPMDKPARIEAGTWMLEVKKPDYYPVSKSVTIPPTGLARVTIEMKLSKVEPPPKEPEPPPPTPAAAPTIVSHPVAPPRANEAPPSTMSPTWGFIALGTGVAAFGVIALTRRNHFANEFNDDARCGTAAASPTASCTDARDATSTWQTLSITGFVAGGLLVGTGVVLLVSSSSHEKTTALACGTGPGHVGVACTVKF